MSKIIADFHIHSRYSRATSKAMDIIHIAAWAKRKGINLLGTGDFTHPAHFEHLKSSLIPSGNGLYANPEEPTVSFILTSEISSIYKYKGKVRKIHSLIMAPSIEIVEKINNMLKRYGNISSDGRPILGLSAKDLLKITLDTSEDCLFVPAHAWTPWFSLFGSKSGFDTIEECFDEYSRHIFAIETGLSSDPEMNWRISALDNLALISNSDAHSPNKLGVEANVFDCTMDYHEIMDAIKTKDRERFLYTMEFFPEEGKYHFDGHRACNIVCSPEETTKYNGICPVCSKPLTVGVMNRVNELADREEGYVPDNLIPSKHLVPLEEIISQAFQTGVASMKVKREYETLVAKHSEFSILLELSENELLNIADQKTAEGILKVRAGNVQSTPGYDGEYGKISVFSSGVKNGMEKQKKPAQNN
jgi:uncharacterized protein (TIGR00375 family)